MKNLLVLFASVAGAMASDSIIDSNHPEMLALADKIASRNRRRGLSGNTLSQTDKNDILALHNKVRADTARGEYQCAGGNCPEGANMQKLQWSEALADIAVEWSAKCKFAHRANSANTNDHCKAALAARTSQIDFKGFTTGASCGENLAASGMGPKWSAFAMNGGTHKREDFGIAGMVEGGWSKSEAKMWNSANEWKFNHHTGHYTQVVWAETRYVGCGISYCSGKTGADPSWMRTLLTCNYYPPGNYRGQVKNGVSTPASKQPYIAGKACSQCDAGQTCTSESYNTQPAAAPAPTTYDLTGLCTGASSGASSGASNSAATPKPKTIAPPPPKKSSGSKKFYKNAAQLDAALGIKREKRCPSDLVAMPKRYTLNNFGTSLKSMYRIDINGVYTFTGCSNGASQYQKNDGSVLQFYRRGYPLGGNGVGWVVFKGRAYLGLFDGAMSLATKPASKYWKHVIHRTFNGYGYQVAPAGAFVCEGNYYKC